MQPFCVGCECLAFGLRPWATPHFPTIHGRQAWRMPTIFGGVASSASEAKAMAEIDDRIFTLEQYDRQSFRLEWSLRLQGGSTEEIRQLVTAREAERERLVGLMGYGRKSDD